VSTAGVKDSTRDGGRHGNRSVELFLSQVRLEQKSFWRNRQAAAFAFAMPLLLLVLFGSLFDSEFAPGVPFRDYFVAGMLGVALMSATFTTLAMNLTYHRDLLVLKRFRGTPVTPTVLFAGKVVSCILVVVLQTAFVLGVGRIFYDVPFPQNWLAFLVFLIVGIVVFSVLGIAYTVLIPNADSAPAVVQLPFLVLQFISGIYFSLHASPKFLQWTASLFPLRWLVEGIRAGYLGLDFVHVDQMPDPDGSGTVYVPHEVHGLHAISSQWLGLLVLGIWLVIGLWAARTRFRWEKRSG
jgi:ABC-2 type transport system permease protein